MSATDLVRGALVALAILLPTTAARADEPDWATTMKYLKSYFDDTGFTSTTKDNNDTLTYRPLDVIEDSLTPDPGTFTYISTYRTESKFEGRVFATITIWTEVKIDLKKLDPALFKVTQEKQTEAKVFRLTLAGAKGSEPFTCTSLGQHMFLKEQPDLKKRGEVVKGNSTTIDFKTEETAKAANKAFRRAAILSGAKESEKDPFKD